MNKAALMVIVLLSCTHLSGQGQVLFKNCRAEKLSFKNTDSFKENTSTDNYDIVYHRIRWEVDPSTRYIKGAVYSLFKITAATSEVVFELDNNLSVDSITSNAEKLAFTHLNNRINIALGTSLASEEIDSLTIYYQGAPSSSGFGSFSTSTHGEKKSPILWTLSEPYGAMEWWPCKQSLSDKIDSIDIYVETPKDDRVGSNGKLMFEQINGSKRLTYWKHRHPIATYLVAISVTNYESYSQHARVSETDSVEILNFVYPESRSYAEPLTAYTASVIELLSNKFIPYPFFDEKYGHAQFGWGGGMEHQTMSFVGSFSPELLTHELAHQWFGDYITCASWQDIWVNEGFTVFCEGLVTENLHPENWMDWKKNKIDNVISNAPSGSIHVDDTSNVNRIFNYALTYQKGGLLLHMLRHQIGDEVFFSAINNYLSLPTSGIRFATTENVKGFFEESADTSLTDFFNDWYYGQGYPKYSINILYSSKDSLAFTISQVSTHSSVDFFELKIPILFSGADGSFTQTFNNTKNEQLYQIKTGFLVESIEFDPEYTIVAPHPAQVTYPFNIRKLLEKRIVVSPNPSQEIFRVSFNNGLNIRNYKLFDLSGKMLLEGNTNNIQSSFTINVSGVSSGQLILKLETADSTITKKLIKE